MPVRKRLQCKGDGLRFPRPLDTVTISCKTWIYDLSKIEDDFKGKQIGHNFVLLSLKLGQGLLLDAYEHEIVKMSVGEKAYFTIPSELAYGSKGLANMVPPNSSLVTYIELLAIKSDRNPSKS